MYNDDIIGTTFPSRHGATATYINARRVPEGFRILCESTPHHAYDHIVYGRRSDGQYIGVGQPYPMCGDALREVNEYCHVIGMEMMLTAGSTWNDDCIRLLFQRDDCNAERFDIAVNCSRWHGNYPSVGNTQNVVDGVNMRIDRQNSDILR